MREEKVHTLTTLATPIDAAGSGQLTDEEIVTLVRDGYASLFEILMRRYNQRIYRIVRTILRDDSEAEDVMQEAYVRAYQHLGGFAGQAKFSTWLTKIAIHEAFARLRRFARTGGPVAVPDQDSDIGYMMRSKERDPEAQTYDHELRSVLENAISALPDAYRAVFVLRVVEGLNINETAAALDVGVETVKTRLHRGRALLRKTLQDRAGIVAQQIFPFHASRCNRVVETVLRAITPL